MQFNIVAVAGVSNGSALSLQARDGDIKRGIDNTVVAHGAPIWFIKGQPPEPFLPAQPITLAIADSGIRAPTKETVGDVRRAWTADPETYEALFDNIAAVVSLPAVALPNCPAIVMLPLPAGLTKYIWPALS